MKRILSRVAVGVLVSASVMALGSAADRAFAAEVAPSGSPLLRTARCSLGLLSTNTRVIVSKCNYAPQSLTGWVAGYTETLNSGTGNTRCPYSPTAFPGGNSDRVIKMWVGPLTGTPYGDIPAHSFICAAHHGYPILNNYSMTWSTIRPSSGPTQATCLQANASFQWYDPPGTSKEECIWQGQLSTAQWDALAWPVDWFPGAADPNPPLVRSCDVMGISYRTKAVGSSSWSTVTGGSWPALPFGSLIEWSISLNATEFVDSLLFVMIGESPLSYTGDPPNWSPGQLEPFAIDVLDGAFTSNDEWMSGVGIGAQWEIRPGDANATTIGPATLTGSFLWLGHNGSVPAFNVDCRANNVRVRFNQNAVAIGGTVLDQPACSAWRVFPWEPAGSDTTWGFKFTKPSSTTGFVSLSWRVDADPPGAWSAIYTPPAPITAAHDYLFSIAKVSLVDPMAVEWRCEGVVAGGGTRTDDKLTDNNTADNSTYGREGQEQGCYSRVVSGMSLTSPRSWVTGGGKLAVCLVEFLVVPSPDYLSEQYNDFEDELEAQTPFSFLFIMDGFLADVEDTVTDMEAGDAPNLPVASFTIGGATVDTAGMAPGAVVGAGVDPADRTLLTLLLLAGVVWGVLKHAAGLLFGSPVVEDDSGEQAASVRSTLKPIY